MEPRIIPSEFANKIREFNANIDALIQRREGFLAGVLVAMGLDGDGYNFDFSRMTVSKPEPEQDA